jgi:hypothetical protein
MRLCGIGGVFGYGVCWVFEWMWIECVYDVASGGGNFPLFGKNNRDIQRSIDIIIYNRVNLQLIETIYLDYEDLSRNRSF